ncbi:helix-turn-helix domain-containing protein [Candidiatus Paracoxiella cheracis]|uniref:helix-turn-helix domain-containing protein n=1 Tax=Candidiatus Paracoxiella cheracis TaxID=3405120 RepID=UPI003BF5CBBC
MKFGKRFRSLRATSCGNQEGLAKKIGISRVAVSQWEDEKVQKISLDPFLRACAIFGVNPYHLRYGSDVKKYIPEYNPVKMFGEFQGNQSLEIEINKKINRINSLLEKISTETEELKSILCKIS